MELRDLPKIKSDYPEGVLTFFQQELSESECKQEEIVDHHYETYLFASSQLPGPDNTTGPGFQNTGEWLLGDRIPFKCTSIINDAGWSLYRLLTATHEDLQQIGIAFESDRMTILEAVRAFHLAPWRTMQTICLKPDNSYKKHKDHLVYQLETFTRLTQQLYIDTATIAWLRKRIALKCTDTDRLKASVKKTTEANSNLTTLIDGIYHHTVKLNAGLPCRPIDYIGPIDKRSLPMYKRIFFSSVFVISVFVLSPMISEKLAQTVLQSVTKLPFKWCILLGWLFS